MKNAVTSAACCSTNDFNFALVCRMLCIRCLFVAATSPFLVKYLSILPVRLCTKKKNV